MKKADVYEALGLEVPSEKPAVATPGSAEGSQGGQGQEIADPAVREEQNNNSGEDPSTAARSPSPASRGGFETGGRIATSASPPRNDRTGEDPSSASVPSAPSPKGEGLETEGPEKGGGTSKAPSPAEGQEMSREERARQARLRREREQQAAVDAAVQKANQEAQEKADREFAGLLKELGLTNRYRDNAPITNRQEYQQWQKDASDEKLSQQLRSGKLTKEGLQQVVGESEEVRALRAEVEQLKAQAAARQRQEADRQIQRELEEIRQLDPTVKTVKDILDMETGQEFSRLVQERGMTFVEAFRLANAEKLQKTQQRAAEEQQARSYHSKDHLVGVGSNSRTPVTIPLQTYNAYRTLRPELTDEEIRQDYAKRHKK